MTEPLRILQIVSSLNTGSGMLSVVLNWHHHIDTSRVQFDYLYIHVSPSMRKEEIARLGGKSYRLPHPFQHPFRFLKESFLFFKKHRYTTVHSHITHLNFFFYPLAKIFGTKNIIQHAHGSKWSDKKINGWRNYLMLHAVWPLINEKLACSQLAGQVYFGKNFKVINNGIEIEKFIYNPVVRITKRKELGLENSFVVGHVGRFSREKNHSFLVNVFAKLVKQEPTARLVLVGTGRMEKEIRQQVVKQGLTEKVLFLGARKDVAELYQAFDCLVLPSLHEGFPMVGVEAQAAGLPCLFADTITPEILLLPTSLMISLEETADRWAWQVLLLKGTTHVLGDEVLRAKGFDVCQVARQIQDFYEGLEK